MKRLVFDTLLNWKKSPDRKPLVLQGGRQIGKTWILKEFGKTYKDGFLYINFDYQNEYIDCFTSKDPAKIIDFLTIKSGKNITSETLIILDEIQECSNALNSLKYFNEEYKKYHVVCAGSLLGLYLNSKGFPVGQVDFLNMEPMTFSEFLIAIGKEKYKDVLTNISIKNSYSALHQDFINFLKIYLMVGGMPAAINTYVETKDFNKVIETQQSIVDAYSKDFSKHSVKSNIFKIGYIWDSIPSQLAKENKKFLYSAVKTGARAREYEDAVIWLSKSNLVNLVYNVSKVENPLSFYKDLSSFKMYIFDTGLLSYMSKIPLKSLLDNNMFCEFKGAITENYIAQCLWNNFRDKPYYYANSIKRQEIDFIIQTNDGIYPTEVKSGTSVRSKSLKLLLRKNPNIQFGVRYSLNELKLDGRILNIPLYMAEQTNKIIQQALKKE